MQYVGILMAVVYLFFGIALVAGVIRPGIPPTYTLVLGILTICYAIFRGVNVYQKYYRDRT
jgi:hypothetical protein